MIASGMMGLSYTPEGGQRFFDSLGDSRALPLLDRINQALAHREVQGYVVGGFIRDLLLCRATVDIDIAVAGDATEVARHVADAIDGRYVLLGPDNRAARVIAPEAPGDGEAPGQLDFASLEADIETDLARRDFSVNAMAVDLRQMVDGDGGTWLIDPCGGCGDLGMKLVRCLSPEVFETDPARLLRAVRLAAELGFAIEEGTAAAIRRHAHLVSAVAGERLREELVRLLSLPGSGRFFGHMRNLGLLMALIPEMEVAEGVGQPKEHHWDVLEHSLRTAVAVDFLLREGDWEFSGAEALDGVPWSAELAEHLHRTVGGGSNGVALLRLAALLHDVAKPQTRTVDETGRLRFIGHPQQGAAIAAEVLGRLRFSVREARIVESLVRNHLRPVQMSQAGMPTPRAIYRFFRDTGEAGVDTLFLSLADHLASRGPQLEMAGWREHVDITAHVLKQHFEARSQPKPAKLVDGHDLMAVFGLSPGPALGELLEAVREAQAAGEVTYREEALAYVRGLPQTAISRRLKERGR